MSFVNLFEGGMGVILSRGFGDFFVVKVRKFVDLKGSVIIIFGGV